MTGRGCSGAALALALAGCGVFPAFAPPRLVAPAGLDVTSLGVLPTAGTSRLVGTARVPDVGTAGRKVQAFAEHAAAGARVQVLDADLNPTAIEATADADGQFLLDLIPKNKSIVLQVTTTIDGKPATLHKVARPDAALACVKVDLATTLVADKMLSNGEKALFKADLPLENAPLLELFKAAELAAFEENIRRGLTFEDEDKPRIADILTGGVPGATISVSAVDLFDELATLAPQLVEDYHQKVFERPEAELRFSIKATGYVRNKDRKKQTISGAFTLALSGVAAGTRAVEFWFTSPDRVKLGEANAANGWSTTVDTFQYPDGPYGMVSILMPESGKKQALGSVEITIDNSYTGHCE